MRNFKTANRAQSIGIARLFLALGAGFVVIMIVNEVTSPLFKHSKESGSGQVATNGTTLMQQAVNNLPLVFLVISVFGVVAVAVFRRRVMGV